MDTFKIVRVYFNTSRKITLRRHLTFDEARAHCSDPETSYSTCTSSKGKARTRRLGPWFDSFTKEIPR